MLEWSDVDIAVRDAVRDFVDKEVRPHVDALESGDMEPYPVIRKLFTAFGIDALALARKNPDRQVVAALQREVEEAVAHGEDAEHRGRAE